MMTKPVATDMLTGRNQGESAAAVPPPMQDHSGEDKAQDEGDSTALEKLYLAVVKKGEEPTNANIMQAWCQALLPKLAGPTGDHHSTVQS